MLWVFLFLLLTVLAISHDVGVISCLVSAHTDSTPSARSGAGGGIRFARFYHHSSHDADMSCVLDLVNVSTVNVLHQQFC